MSFPGGRADPGESDENTAAREVLEEVGWDLHDRERFVRIGQLDDKAMDGLKNVKPLAVAVFGQLEEWTHARQCKHQQC
jgi:8-oxo-dGTP pyrophosphatase MutT (NUDIX family)